MAIVVVGGSSRGVGKTALLCGLIAALPEFRWTAVKITTHDHNQPGSPGRPDAAGDPTPDLPHNLGAPSFPRLLAERVGDHEPQPPSIPDLSIWEETTPGQGSDTARYLAAGAHRAFLVTAQQSDLPQRLRELQAAVEPGAHLIFESNRILAHLQPDLCLGVLGSPETPIKPSFQLFLRGANAFVAPAQPEETLAPVNGTGFSPYISPAKSMQALAPEGGFSGDFSSVPSVPADPAPAIPDPSKPLFRLAALERISPAMLAWVRQALHS